MANPHVYQEVNESRWNWDSDTKTATAHGFVAIVGFTVIKNSLDYLKGF